MNFLKKHKNIFLAIVFVFCLIAASYGSPIYHEAPVSAGMLQFCDVMWDGNPLPPAAPCCDSAQCGGGYSCNGVNGSNPGTCQPPAAVCGNGIIESGETCDGASLNGQSCATQGFAGGTLSCNGSCNGYTTSACYMSCTGSNPSNATACASDATPPVNTAKTVVSSCTPAGGGNPWCEFTCNPGYMLSGGVCVAVPTPVCTGSNPANATMCAGDNTPTTDTPKVLVSSCTPKLGGSPWCEFICNNGFTYTPGGRGGPGTCVANQNPPAADNNICGFAWGGTSEGTAMGIGWISFNSKDCDTNNDGSYGAGDNGAPGCPTSGTAYPYGVSYNPNTGALTGQAWSNNIGWLIFGGLSGFPSGGGTNAANATLNGDPDTIGAYLSGWAKFLSADDNGWDGWVSLKGTSYGVTVASRQFSGYSWGDDVVGWVNWNPGAGNGVRFCDALTLTATLDAPEQAQIDTPVTLVANSGGTYTGTKNYEFKCFSSDTWHDVDAQTTYQCTYGTTGAKVASVRVTGGTLSAEASDTINITSGPTSGGGLTVACDAIPPAYVNQPFEWTAEVTDDLTPQTTTYSYDWEFSDPTPAKVEDENTNNPKTTYPTIGIKNATVTVTDTVDFASDDCPAFVNVKVKPSFIEI